VAKDPLPGIDMIVFVLDGDLLGHEGVEGGAALGRPPARPLDQLGRLGVPRLQRILKPNKCHSRIVLQTVSEPERWRIQEL
jgi:hypothetical protein